MIGRRTLICFVTLASVALAAPPARATAGQSLWTATYNGPTAGPDTPVGMAIDPNLHRVYVVGTTGDDQAADIVTIAYNIDTGDKIWARRYDGPARGGDLGVAIAYDQFFGGVVVTGASESAAGTGRIDAVTISYQSDGSRIWTRRASSPSTDAPIGLAVSGGDIFVLLNGPHGRLIDYDFTGDRMWAHRLTDDTVLGLVGLRMIGGYLMATGTVSLTVPANSNTGTVLRLKGKGIPPHSGESAGDLYVRLVLSLPDQADESLRNFAQGWSASYDPRAKMR